jgi:Spy/CpxP family protein refolding chaperone
MPGGNFMKLRAQTKLIRVILTSLAVVLLSVGLTSAKGLNDNRHGERHIKMMQYLLDLSDEQVTQSKAIIESHRETMKEDRDKVMTARKTFRDLAKSTTEEAAIRAAFSPVAKALEDAAVHRIQMRNELQEILTPEQAARAEELHELMPDGPKMGRMHGHHGPPPVEQE